MISLILNGSGVVILINIGFVSLSLNGGRVIKQVVLNRTCKSRGIVSLK